jgi:hypothetical protein
VFALVSVPVYAKILVDVEKMFRMFQDKKGIHYPSSIDVIVIVSKTANFHRELWFPFELRLDCGLTVDVHGLRSRVNRLVSRADKHDA